jgi:hypothetical protein
MIESIRCNSMLSSLALNWRRKLNRPCGSEKKSIIRAGGADGTVARGYAQLRSASPQAIAPMAPPAQDKSIFFTTYGTRNIVLDESPGTEVPG